MKAANQKSYTKTFYLQLPPRKQITNTKMSNRNEDQLPIEVDDEDIEETNPVQGDANSDAQLGMSLSLSITS